MLLDYNSQISKYLQNPPLKGVLHIGGHHGQEIELYEALKVKSIWFEPMSSSFSVLKNKLTSYSDTQCYNLALGDMTGEISINIASNGQSSSILTPKKHLQFHPGVKFSGEEIVKINKLDNIEFDRTQYNFINIDVQGYELEVFKGAKDTLNYIDYISTEVNRDFTYENNALIEEIDSFLDFYGFKRVETKWYNIWGDALYVKIT